MRCLSSSRWRLAWCLAAALFISSRPQLPAQTASEPRGNPSEQPSLTQQIESLQSKVQQLVQRLSERTKQVDNLNEALTQARQSSDASAASLEALEEQYRQARTSESILRTELRATLNWLDRLKETQQRSLDAWESYRTEMRDQVEALRRERGDWELAAWAGIGAAGGAITGSAIGKDWISTAAGALVGAAAGAAADLVKNFLRRIP